MATPGLPKQPFEIQGGCNCKAVRYKVSIPEFSHRPLTPYKTAGADIGDLRIPMSVICMCNNCRSATSALAPTALLTDITTVEVALVGKTPVSGIQGPLSIEGSQKYMPAEEMFNFRNPDLDGTFLAFFKSSPGRSRWFCSRCGTPIAYTVDEGQIPEEWGWPKMLDIWVGTVDRCDLEHAWMAPERVLWCDYGLPWVMRTVLRGGLGSGGLPGHPSSRIDETFREDVEVDPGDVARGDQSK